MRKKKIYTTIINILIKIIFTLLFFTVPFVIGFLWDKCDIMEWTSVTADGILTYLGCVITVYAMCYEIQKSIEANKQILEQNADLEYLRRRTEICPKFVIFVSKCGCNLYDLEILNISNNVAMDIFLCGTEFKEYLKGGEKFETIISIGANDNAEFQLSHDIKMSADDMPKQLSLTYSDCDNHTANLNFTHYRDNFYCSGNPQYDT